MVILNVALSRRATRAQAWATVQERWADLAPRLRADEGTWLVQQAASSACDPRRRAEAAAFLGPRAEAFEGAPRALASALERADACIASRKLHEASISRFLARSGGAP
jgi:hypothetical protein